MNTKKLFLFPALLVMSVPAFAAKDCGELKSEIESKIQANGVPSYSLEVVDSDAATNKKVVGTCGGGTKKIVYQRGGANERDVMVMEVEE